METTSSTLCFLLGPSLHLGKQQAALLAAVPLGAREGFYQGGMQGKEGLGMLWQCGRRAAPGLCCHVPGRGPVRSWGPLRVGKSEKYFPKLVFGQLQPTLSNDTKQTGIWILQFFNPNRCLPTPDLLSPSWDALFAFSCLHCSNPDMNCPQLPCHLCLWATFQLICQLAPRH